MVDERQLDAAAMLDLRREAVRLLPPDRRRAAGHPLPLVLGDPAWADDAGAAVSGKLLLPFNTDSAEFTRGFECGHVWTKLRETDEREFTVHWTNAEMMLRVAEALGLEVEARELDEAWTEVVFTGVVAA